MSTKTLTISIAAYNVADYIKETLDSLVASAYIDQLEIFVVDDGGQDETLQIAKEYQEQFPGSIFPIHKENGGYGTTVNYSLEHASGKYFKLLDGDDWFDTAALDQLMAVLEQAETDIIVTPYHQGSTRETMKLVSFEDVFSPGEHTISDLKIRRAISMWSICYRTAILREAKLQLPARLLYTDQYFALYPFAVATTIAYHPYSVYQYRLGRDGQSVSRESRIKNLQMMADINKDLVAFSEAHQAHANADYIFYRTMVTYRNTMRTFLLLPFTAENAQRMKAYDDEIKSISPAMYATLENPTFHKKSSYFMGLWRKTKYRLHPLLKVIYPKGTPNF